MLIFLPYPLFLLYERRVIRCPEYLLVGFLVPEGAPGGECGAQQKGENESGAWPPADLQPQPVTITLMWPGVEALTSRMHPPWIL